MNGPISTARVDYIPLTQDEINAFFDDLDRDKDGYVTFNELEAKLRDAHKELAPVPQRHHLHHPSRRNSESHVGAHDDDLHNFLCSLMPDCGSSMGRSDFVERVQRWQVPSQSQTDTKTQSHEDKAAEQRLPFRRRLRAYWAVHGPVFCFLAFVVALQLAFGLWQLIAYIRKPDVRAALGWGVILAKACAGVLYPTIFFMLLSMSRHFSTFLRRSYWISKFVNWDLSQAFHIKMSICGLLFATLHAIGHLTGTFLTGSRPGRQEALANVLGPEAVPKPYTAFIASLPGWSGIAALGMFWIISLLSMPWMRRRSYEVFQIGHLLMFPMIALLCAHGTAALLQAPMLGYWLAFPAILVIFERSWRLIRGFMGVPTKAKVLDENTVEIVCKHPRGKDWRYSAGQYILLQVPKVSFFQWHAFTISSCRKDILSVHIKCDGDWTNKLRDIALENDEIKVGIDGPFGAPAQRFYDYDYSIIVGGGIGITPFSAILTDLEESFEEQRDPWDERRRSRSRSRPGSRRSSRAPSEKQIQDFEKPARHPNPEQRVDFHWSVREKNDLLWFSDLLNRAIEGSHTQRLHGKLELNINTHITAKRKNISTHVFRYLLDSYRTRSAPYSALTGLKQPSHFGRPDYDKILDEHFGEMVASGVSELKIGVFVSYARSV